MRHGWLRHFLDIETSPHTQLAVHVWGQRFWLANVPIVSYLAIFRPAIWLGAGLLLTTLYSLYANWSTDNGAAAAINTVINTNRCAANPHHGDER